MYQISSFTAFPGGSSMENAGLDPASSCSEHSCLRQGPGGTLPLFWRLKGMWGLWWPPAQSHFCSWLLGWHRSLGAARVVSQPKLWPSSALLWGVFCPFWIARWQHNKVGLGSGLEFLKPYLHWNCALKRAFLLSLTCSHATLPRAALLTLFIIW